MEDKRMSEDVKLDQKELSENKGNSCECGCTIFKENDKSHEIKKAE